MRLFLAKTWIVLSFLLLSVNIAPAQQLNCFLGSSPQWESGWCDLRPSMNFSSGERLRIVVGGTARQILVRLLPQGGDPNSPAGIVGSSRRIPSNRTLEIVLESNYSRISQISVHGGSNPFNIAPLGQDNGPATIISIERLTPQRR